MIDRKLFQIPSKGHNPSAISPFQHKVACAVQREIQALVKLLIFIPIYFQLKAELANLNQATLFCI